VYIKYSEEPNTLPCGTPDFASLFAISKKFKMKVVRL
jgi:hypothetical protein